jgi:hypothetical protein
MMPTAADLAEQTYQKLVARPPPGVSRGEVRAWWSTHGAALVADLHRRMHQKAPMVESFHRFAGPRPGEAGVVAPGSAALLLPPLAARLSAEAARLLEEPETAWAWQAWQDGVAPEDHCAEDDGLLDDGYLDDDDDGYRDDDDLHEEDCRDAAPLRIGDLLDVPGEVPGRGVITDVERDTIAGHALHHALGERDWKTPRWLSEAALIELMEHPDAERRLRLAPVSVADAEAFIARHHSKLPKINRRGLLYALGARVGAKLVAVGTVGTPTGRWSQPARVVELTRVASDGSVRNAASMLVSRVIDALPRVAPRGPVTEPPVLVTYQLEAEHGATYRALADKGLRPVARVAGRAPSGARSGSRDALAEASKIRWEAGPGAGPADWSLLRGAA